MKKVSAILTSDWHIRDDRPVCRTDNYMETQARKINFILNLSDQYDCPILVAGDFGHKPYWGDRLLNQIIKLFKGWGYKNIIVTPGQHDLPYHQLDKLYEGGLGVLEYADCIKIISECYNGNSKFLLFAYPYGVKIKSTKHDYKERSIALIHQMVIKSQKDKLWNDQVSDSAEELLKKFPCYDLIVSGDNHQTFDVEYKGRRLVNPGSIMRMTTDQINHKPCVYLWSAEDNSIKKVYLPIEENVIDKTHIDIKKDYDTRTEAFVNSLKSGQYEIGFTFKNNVEQYFKINRTHSRVKEIAWESLEEN